MPIDPNLSEQVDNEEIKCYQKRLKDSDADLICDIIKKNKVTKLMLARNLLTHEAAVKIAEAMCTNTSIKVLSLGGNQFRDEGIECWAKMIKENTTVEQLLLCSNFASEKACDVLWEANATREKPFTDNLYGLVLDHISPDQRRRVADAKVAAKGGMKTVAAKASS